MPYDLTRLGSERFEHLVQALAIGSLGHGVQVFGVGPDGGREATFDGPVNMEGKGTWTGYGVIQAKHKRRLTTTAADQTWFFQELTEELDKWIDAKSNRRRRQPRYLVIATNVTLTPAGHGGGLDRLERLIADYRDRKDSEGNRVGLTELTDYTVWHAEGLDRMLENNAEVRHAYADLVLPGDVITRLYAMLTERDEKVAEAWIGHVARSIDADLNVELGESGDSANTPLALADVAVDLPAVLGPAASDTPALGGLIARADNVLSPLLQPRHKDCVVVIGGPGSGKSTLSKLICQIYRAELLADEAQGRITAQINQSARRLREAFDAGDLPRPTLHRLPIRVALSSYADAVSKPGQPTLLTYITDTINRRASETITVAEAKRLLAQWPAIVVLDGLDEVASADIRAEVSTRIADFLTEMAALQADVLTVCTSRPIGFELDRRIDFDPLHLTPLGVADATRYARRLLAHRHPHNPDRQAETVQRLEESAKSADTARLMTSPLQVTILTILLEQRTRAPSSRFALFNSYYEIVYTRETGKASWIGELLEAHKPQVNALHERCALTIHARAERAGEAESILPRSELERIARELLTEEGYSDEAARPLVGNLLRIADERLVLMVPRADGVAFEVRSLAEFFAARALMAGEDAVEKLEIMVPSAHWRHTWLLAAGYIYAQRTGLRDAVAGALNRVDEGSWANRLVMPGALLAIDALADGFATHAPRYERQLAVSALRLLDGPIGPHISRLARELAPLMNASTDVRKTVTIEIEQRLAHGQHGATRAFLSALADTAPDEIATAAAMRLVRYDESRPAEAPDDPLPTNGTSESRLDVARQRLLAGGVPVDRLPEQGRLLDVLRETYDGSSAKQWVLAAREEVAEACLASASERPRARSLLAEAIQRDDVGHLLTDSSSHHPPNQ